MSFDEWYYDWYKKRYCEGMTESESLELYKRVHTGDKIKAVKDLMHFSWNESRRTLEDIKEFPFKNPFNW